MWSIGSRISQRQDHKWIIMWDGWRTVCELHTKAKYCDPDRFGMYIYNDYHGWGLQELMEHQVHIIVLSRPQNAIC